MILDHGHMMPVKKMATLVGTAKMILLSLEDAASRVKAVNYV